MTLDEFRQNMGEYWRTVDREADDLRYPFHAVEQLKKLYEKFDAEERKMADEVFSEWALLDDGRKRFDALWLIEGLKITSALPALRELAKHLQTSRERSASSDLNYVTSILGKLDDGSV